jgi:epoxyqueuosine reductase QueG
MDKKRNYVALERLSKNLGADLFGVADITKIKESFLLSQRAVQKLDKAVSLGVRLSQGVLSEIDNFPTRLYFHHYRSVNVFLDQLALKVSNHIQNKGFLTLPVPASQILDWQNQKAHLSHKQIGYLAGLGWIGRNNLLVNNKLGSQFRLVSVLTDLPLAADKPKKEDCGKCMLCVEICPAQAIKEDAVNFDHMKCFEKLKEFQKQRLVDQYICGVCVNACQGKEK